MYQNVSEEDVKLGTMVKHWMFNETCVEERPSYNVNDEWKDGPRPGGIPEPTVSWYNGDTIYPSHQPTDNIEVVVMEYVQGTAHMTGRLHTEWKTNMGGNDTYVPHCGHGRAHAFLNKIQRGRSPANRIL